jgi:hypothetical protein
MFDVIVTVVCVCLRLRECEAWQAAMPRMTMIDEPETG